MKKNQQPKAINKNNIISQAEMDRMNAELDDIPQTQEETWEEQYQDILAALKNPKNTKVQIAELKKLEVALGRRLKKPGYEVQVKETKPVKPKKTIIKPKSSKSTVDTPVQESVQEDVPKEIQEDTTKEDKIIENFKEQLEQKKPQTIKEILLSKGITEDKIKKLKMQHNNELYSIAFSADEVFIFKPIYYLQYKSIIQNNNLQEGTNEYNEMLVRTGMIFPVLDEAAGFNMYKSGTVYILSNLIQYVSNMLGMDTALQLVEQL